VETSWWRLSHGEGQWTKGQSRRSWTASPLPASVTNPKGGHVQRVDCPRRYSGVFAKPPLCLPTDGARVAWRGDASVPLPEDEHTNAFALYASSSRGDGTMGSRAGSFSRQITEAAGQGRNEEGGATHRSSTTLLAARRTTPTSP
jgi:hypothetical protein